MSLTIYPRSSWGARPPRSRSPLRNTTNGWFWHWLGNGYPEQMSDEQILQSVQRYHMDTKGWSDIAYSFAVGRDGDLFELRGWDVAGGHTRGYNSTSMAICFLIGVGERPTPAMYNAAWNLTLSRPEMRGPRPHRAVGQTTCPGDDIARETIVKLHYPRSLQVPTMSLEQAKTAITGLYDRILNRAPDEEGLEFWADALANGTAYQDIHNTFVEVRLQADAKKFDAFSKALKGGGVDPQVAAEQAYRMFLDDLIAVRALDD